MRRLRGFTLIEMTLVCMTMAILCAVAMPRYAASIARYRLDCAARRVAADISLTQTHARASSTARTITFTPSTGSYQIANLTDADNGAANYSVSLSREFAISSLSANFNNSAALSFDGFGVPGNSGSVVLSNGAEQRTVSVEAISGAVKIQ